MNIRHLQLAICALVCACEFVPGTEAYDIERAKRTATSSLIDPSTAQFRDVQKHGQWVCGELNAKNRMGAFVGFKRFMVQLDLDEAQLDPEFRFSELLEAEDSCRSLTGNTYASTASTLAACNRASEQRADQVLQSTFDTQWSEHCSPVRAKTPFRPALNDVLANASEPNEAKASDKPLAGPTPAQLEPETSEEEGDEEAKGAVAPAASVPDQSELDRIFNSPPPRQPSAPQPDPSPDPLEPRPNQPQI